MIPPSSRAGPRISRRRCKEAHDPWLLYTGSRCDPRVSRFPPRTGCHLLSDCCALATRCRSHWWSGAWAERWDEEQKEAWEHFLSLCITVDCFWPRSNLASKSFLLTIALWWADDQSECWMQHFGYVCGKTYFTGQQMLVSGNEIKRQFIFYHNRSLELDDKIN